MAKLAYTLHNLVLIFISLIYTFALLLPMAHLDQIYYKIVLFSSA
jgi:hypothetical protein